MSGPHRDYASNWMVILVIFGVFIFTNIGISQTVAPNAFVGTFGMTENVSPTEAGGWSGTGSVSSTPISLVRELTASSPSYSGGPINDNTGDYSGNYEAGLNSANPCYRTETGYLASVALTLNLSDQSAFLSFGYIDNWQNYFPDWPGGPVTNAGRAGGDPSGIACGFTVNDGVITVDLSGTLSLPPGQIFGDAVVSYTTSGTLQYVPPPIVANSQSISTAVETPVLITLSATGGDGNALTYAVDEPPTNGTLNGDPPNITYSPNGGFIGSDSFTFQATDGQQHSAPATVFIEVTGSLIEFLDPPGSLAPSVRPRAYPPDHTYNLSPSVTPQPLTVMVEDSSGNGVADVSVQISITGNNKPAGHDRPHDPEAVHGWIFQTTNDAEDAGITAKKKDTVGQDTLGGSKEDRTLTFNTDEKGMISFVYIPAEVSGVDTLTAEIVGQPDVIPASADILVKVDGLIPVKGLASFPSSLVTFIGVTPIHSMNWYATAATISRLQSVAMSYHDAQAGNAILTATIALLKDDGYDFPVPSGALSGSVFTLSSEPEVLFLNDMSLPWGGLFDVGKTNLGNYAAPHGGHRDGSNVDIKSLQLVTGPAYSANSLGVITQPAPVDSSVRDARLVLGTSPFRNEDYYTNVVGELVHYDGRIRQEMDEAVIAIHYRRLQLIISSLQAVGCSFANEGTPYHIHVKFPQSD